MSDDLEIRGGGAVAVDTATLRAAAAQFTALARELDEIGLIVGSASLRLFEQSHGVEASYAIELSRRKIVAATDEAHDVAAALDDAAAVYEMVELRAERAAAEATGDHAGLARIDARLGVLARDHPDAADRAASGTHAHELGWPRALAAQSPGLMWGLGPGLHAFAVPLAWSALWAVGAAGGGTVASTARLRGPVKNVVVAPVAPRGPAGAPSTLADAAARVPGGSEARVRVERYTMADGSRQFAVYVTGTQTVAPHTEEAFDMASNVELYTGERSASYEATIAALRDAGAGPGDVVHAFGHSQGAMVAGRLALEGGYDTRTLVSFGSPVDVDVGDGTLSVALRHGDDPVAALATGGHSQAVGAPGSFIAERTADALPGPHDLGMPAHGIDVYTRTAQLLDASDDPRMGAVRDVFDALGGAASVEVTEYAVSRAPTARRGASGGE